MGLTSQMEASVREPDCPSMNEPVRILPKPVWLVMTSGMT